MENLPATGQCFVNARGQKIAFRTFLPDKNPPRGWVLFFHGFTRHNNAPQWAGLSRRVAREGYLVVAPDFVGHGYSEGQRAYFSSIQELIDDQVELLQRIVGVKQFLPDEHAGEELTTIQQKCKDLPWLFMGESLGGAASLYTYLELKQKKMILNDIKFQGIVVSAPAIDMINKPPLPAVYVVQALAYFLGRCYLPVALSPIAPDPDCFCSDKADQVFMFETDTLAWNKPMPLATLAVLAGYMYQLPTRFPEVDCPLAILQDPDDKIVSAAGAKLLYETSGTPTSQKTYVELPGMRHSLITTAPEKLVEQVKKLFG